MTKPVSGRSFSVPENQSSLPPSPIRRPSTRFTGGNEIRSMANADNGNCITDAISFLLNKIQSLLGWLFPSLFSPSQTLPNNPPEIQPLIKLSNIEKGLDDKSLKYRTDKSKEMISEIFKYNPYDSCAPSHIVSIFNKKLDPSTFAVIVKVNYGGQEEGYMADYGNCNLNPKQYLEAKMHDFLTRLASQKEGRLVIHATFVQRTSEQEVIHSTVGRSIIFPEGAINFASDWKPFSVYVDIVEGPGIFRFCKYIQDGFAGCENHNTESIFPALPNGVFFSGSCPQQLQRAITELPYPK